MTRFSHWPKALLQKAIGVAWCYPVWGFGPDLAYLSVFNLMGVYAFMVRLASDAR